MHLCTGQPVFEAKPANTILVIPSGNAEIEISLNLNQLGLLVEMGKRAWIQAHCEALPESAEIVALKATRKKRRAGA